MLNRLKKLARNLLDKCQIVIPVILGTTILVLVCPDQFPTIFGSVLAGLWLTLFLSDSKVNR